MSKARLIRIAILAAGVIAAAPDLRAQTSLTASGLSLFTDFDANAAGLRVYSAAFGRYGVSLASDAGPTRLHEMTSVLAGEGRFSGRLSDPGSMSLIGAYTVNQFRVAVDIRRGSFDLDRRRASTELGIGFAGSVTENLSLGAGPTIGFGEVTPSRSPLRTSSGDGARTLGLSGTATLNLSENWALTGVLGYRSRTDGAREDSFFSVLGLGYRF